MSVDVKPESPIKIDLGCGNLKPSGYLGYDKYQHGTMVDVVVDLDAPDVNLGAGDNSVDEIRAYHFLEHIHNLFPLMNECYRILKPGGIFDIVIPMAPDAIAFGDPSHVRFFTSESFHYFTKNPPGNYHNPEINGFWKIITNDWTPLIEEDTEKLIYHKRRELHVILQPEKGETSEDSSNSSNVE